MNLKNGGHFTRFKSKNQAKQQLKTWQEQQEDNLKGDIILGDPGADKGGEGKSKRAGKYDTKKSKERREEPLGTMSYPVPNGRRRSDF